MPPTAHERLKTIFAEAIEKVGPDRHSFLDQACGNDAILRAEVESLLAAAEQAGEFLQSPTAGAPTLTEDTLREGPGSTIGPYKLLQLIGEGGFGSVFMAEQKQPVRRMVALKIIKLGMDTKQVITRFEAERQALAMMDHPNIAKVFDAGATDSGRPYFVMELVKGEPITEHADQNQLTIPQRLELFSQVCHAVQHAHQKGIIHRDIKPRNVLVSIQDGRSFAKVIDFGIAKAMSAQLTEKTLFTEFKQLVGTPQYMSPEQAAGSLDIDTRTDIYSLGVLLYELLTGTTPFSAEELRSAAYDEMRRIIREQEPPKPSTRLSRSTATRASVAALRRSEPKKLDSILRGDLDWIVMKTLEKDRGRRYGTPADIAADLGRYLGNEVVDATPPSVAYQLRKFYRRHRGAVITGTAIVATILAALIVSSVMYRQERIARQQSELAAQQAELARQNEQAQREQAETNFGLACDAVGRLTDIAQNRLMDASDLAGVRRDMLEDAAKFYETFVQARSDNPAVILEAARANTRAGMLRYSIGQPWQAETHELRAVALAEGLYNAQPNRVEYQTELYDCYLDLGRLYEYELNDNVSAEKVFRRAEDVVRPLLDSTPEDHDAQFEMFWLCMERAVNDMDCDRDPEALGELKQALGISQHFAALAPNDTDLAEDVAKVRHLMGYHAARTGAYIEAEADYRTAILIQGRLHIAHPEDEWNTFNFTKSEEYLAEMLTDIGRPREAETLLRESIAEIEPIAQRRSQYQLMADHLDALEGNLGDCLFAQGRFAEAHDAYIKTQDSRRHIYEAHTDHPSRAEGMIVLLVFCPDKSVRDPAAAAGIAQAALQRMPRAQYLWIALGAALYQTGDWQGAIHALQMAPEDLGFMRYVLAAAQLKSGQPELARASFAQAEQWAAVNPPRYRRERFFAAEARQVMLGNGASPGPWGVTTTMPAASESHP
jgi:eukaryotic-like serine/threonine-protein kinase